MFLLTGKGLASLSINKRTNVLSEKKGSFPRGL